LGKVKAKLSIRRKKVHSVRKKKKKASVGEPLGKFHPNRGRKEGETSIVRGEGKIGPDQLAVSRR